MSADTPMPMSAPQTDRHAALVAIRRVLDCFHIDGVADQMPAQQTVSPIRVGDIRKAREAADQLAAPPPLWQHAVSECNAAHKALDAAGVPATKRVRRVRGPDGDQEVTVGLAERILALKNLRHLAAPVGETRFDQPIIELPDKHPLRIRAEKAEAERGRLRAALVGLVGADGREELEQVEIGMRLMPAPAEDKAASIDAIHALLATLPEDANG